MRAKIFSQLLFLAQVTCFANGFEITSNADTDVPTLDLPWGKYQGVPFKDDDNVSPCRPGYI
jgi:hypothetical protein